MIYHGTITMENGAELPFELYPEAALPDTRRR